MAVFGFVRHGLGQRWPAFDLGAVLAARIHGVALSVTFANEVVNQTRKECPEHVQNDLGHIDVLCDCACFHGCSPSKKSVLQPGSCAKPKGWGELVFWASARAAKRLARNIGPSATSTTNNKYISTWYTKL